MTEEHTVFVHVTKFGDLPRARKLAAHIGSEVLGEPQRLVIAGVRPG
ncbi:hypothetical protein [Streptomyces cahuitamycinicus]|nr:hypothetical protein [Streptomyces cahuitamycinicus]